jgi:hypothetical protein
MCNLESLEHGLSEVKVLFVVQWRSSSSSSGGDAPRRRQGSPMSPSSRRCTRKAAHVAAPMPGASQSPGYPSSYRRSTKPGPAPSGGLPRLARGVGGGARELPASASLCKHGGVLDSKPLPRPGAVYVPLIDVRKLVPRRESAPQARACFEWRRRTCSASSSEPGLCGRQPGTMY